MPYNYFRFGLCSNFKSHLFTLVVKLINFFQDYLSPVLLHFPLLGLPSQRASTITSMQLYILGQLPEQNVLHLQFSISSQIFNKLGL